MANSVVRTLFTVAIIASLAAACSKSSGTDSGAPGASPKGTQDGKPVKTPALEMSYELDGYEGCSTGLQTVSGETHEQFAAKFCALLQSGKENKSCAESERLDLFIANCEGPWKPTEVGSRIGSKKRNETPLTDRRPQEMQLALQHLEVLPPAAGTDAQTQTIYKHLSECGLIASCLMSTNVTSGIPAMAVAWSNVLWTPENQIALIAGISAVNDKNSLYGPMTYAVFRFSDSSTRSAPKLEIWTELYPRGFRSFKEFFSHAPSARLVTTLQTQYN